MQEFAGKGVMTAYNNRVYVVDELDFESSPASTFTLKQGTEEKEISYADFYKNRYSVEIKDMSQPLLVNLNKRTGQKVVLIPELCKVTGISEDLKRKNAREVNGVLFANAQEKYKRCKAFFEALMESEKSRLEMKRWGVEIDDSPLPVTAYKLPAGEIEISNQTRIDLERFPDFDRELKGMRHEVPITKWGLIYYKEAGKEANMLLTEIGKCIKDWGYPCQRPKEFVLQRPTVENYMKEIKSIPSDLGVQALLIVMPGRKGASPVYHEIKKYLMHDVSIPCQGILQETLARARGLRSIANKVFTQMVAKTAGSPWSFPKLPLMDVPTMVCGVDVHHASKRESILGFVSSTDLECCTFSSTVIRQKEGEEIGTQLEAAMTTACANFYKKNNNFPKRIVVYRDGVSLSQMQTIL